MKQTILILGVLFSLGATAQPGKKTPGEWKDTTVTVKVWIFTTDDEGYLKKIKGSVSVTSYRGADPSITKQPVQKFTNEKGEAVKPEEGFPINQRQ